MFDFIVECYSFWRFLYITCNGDVWMKRDQNDGFCPLSPLHIVSIVLKCFVFLNIRRVKPFVILQTIWNFSFFNSYENCLTLDLLLDSSEEKNIHCYIITFIFIHFHKFENCKFRYCSPPIQDSFLYKQESRNCNIDFNCWISIDKLWVY